MNLDNKAIIDAMLETLKNDEILSSYVKRFSYGNVSVSRSIFPFVEIGNIHIRPELTLAASIHLIYTFEILVGARSLVPGVAYVGSEAGAKGINDLCDDVVNAVRGKTFNNLLHAPTRISSDANFQRDKGETMCIGHITFDARHIERL